MAKRPKPLRAADYAKALNAMTPEVKEAFERMQITVHALTKAAVEFSMAQAEYLDAKIQSVKKKEKLPTFKDIIGLHVDKPKKGKK